MPTLQCSIGSDHLRVSKGRAGEENQKSEEINGESEPAFAGAAGRFAVNQGLGEGICLALGHVANLYVRQVKTCNISTGRETARTWRLQGRDPE